MDNACLNHLWDVYRSIVRFGKALVDTVGLNLNETMLLCLLSDGEHRLSGEIADQLGLTRSNASKLIVTLERQSLIRRQTCKEDSRCQKFHITKKGIETLEKIRCSDIEMPGKPSWP